MTKRMSVLLVIFTSLVMPIQAQSWVPKFLKKTEKPKVQRLTTKRVTKHPNGNIKESYQIYSTQDGVDLRHGPFQQYNLNGSLKESGVYTDGAKTSVRKFTWYGNGNKSRESLFEYNTKGSTIGKGKVTSYYLNGKAKGTWDYSKGTLVKKVAFYRDGKKESLETFNSDGDPTGVHMAWHENGKKASEYSFKNGARDGHFVEWNSQGTKTRDEVYKDDELIMRDGKKIVINSKYNFVTGGNEANK